MKASALVLGACALILAAVVPSGASGSVSSPRRANECQFPIKSHKGMATCGASMVAVITDPKRYEGKSIHMIGFLEVGGGKIDFFLAAPTQLALEASDPYSCVRIEITSAEIVMLGQPADSIPPGLYVADTTGRFEVVANSWCVGVIRSSEVTIRWRVPSKAGDDVGLASGSPVP